MTHNSLTGHSPRHFWASLFSIFWKCQSRTIWQQKLAGATVLDIRVRRRGNLWQSCHGLIDIWLTFDSVSDIVSFAKAHGCSCRIILERGGSSDLFVKEVNEAVFDEIVNGWQDTLLYAAIKKPWTEIYRNEKYVLGPDYTYIPWNTGQGFWWNIRHFKPSTIKRWAKKHNPELAKYPDIAAAKEIHTIDFL